MMAEVCQLSEVSLNESGVSLRPLSKGRRIGDPKAHELGETNRASAKETTEQQNARLRGHPLSKIWKALAFD